jgi:prophage antirepressor-like protein
METNIQIFNNPRFGEVRVVEIEGKSYFVGIDITRSLGYKNVNDAVTRHCKGYVKHAVPDNNGVMQMMNVIPEGDIYRLAAKSELPGAEEFESWIFDEVLPSIRKHGGYLTPQNIEELLLNPDLIINLATSLKSEREENERLQSQLGQKEEIIEILDKEIETLTPDAQYTRQTLLSNSNLTTTQIAKDLGMSARTLNKKLHELGIQYKVNDQWVLYEKYQDKEYTRANTYTKIVNDESETYHSTVWTEKGRKFIYEIIKQKKKQHERQQVFNIV